MKELTKKEVYDLVVEHLLTQKERCVSDYDESECLYRNESGLKCAVGALIPDNIYRPIIEHGDLRSSNDGPDENDAALQMTLICQGVTEKHFPMLNALQDLHDKHMPEDWIEELKPIRKRFNVKKHELEKTTRLTAAD
jgi:hypothetical protein